MSDDPNVGGEAAGEQQNSAPTPAPAPAAADPAPASASNGPVGGMLSALLNGEAEDGDPAGAGAGAGEGDAGTADDAGGDDWRAAYAGGDEKLLQEIRRYASPQNVAKALVEAKAKIRAGLAPPTLPENATPEQIAEYRKVVGIPETPDGYGIEFSKELQAGDGAKIAAKAFAEFMHQHNVPAQYAKLPTQFYEQWAAQTQRQQAAEFARMESRVYDELADERGPDFKRDMGILKEFGKGDPGIYPVLMANLHDKAFVKAMLDIALQLAPEEAFISGEGGTGGKTSDERIDELATIAATGKRTAAQEREYEALLSRQMKRQERGERNRAA